MNGHSHYVHILAAVDNALINKKGQSSQKAYLKYTNTFCRNTGFHGTFVCFWRTLHLSSRMGNIFHSRQLYVRIPLPLTFFLRLLFLFQYCSLKHKELHLTPCHLGEHLHLISEKCPFGCFYLLKNYRTGSVAQMPHFGIHLKSLSPIPSAVEIRT